MNHPVHDHDAAVIHRMHRATAGIKDHPETYQSSTLAQLRAAAMELEQAADRALLARERP